MNYDKAVSEMLNVDGAIAAAVVDFASGMLLAGGGSPAVDLKIAVAWIADVSSSEEEDSNMMGMKNCIQNVCIYISR